MKTTYKISAQLPAGVIDAYELITQARKIGVELKPDRDGTLEGAWIADLGTLDETIDRLRDVGLGPFMILRSAVSFRASVPATSSGPARQLLKSAANGPISVSVDLFSGEEIFSCVVDCEIASSIGDSLLRLHINKVIATECFTLVTESAQ